MTTDIQNQKLIAALQPLYSDPDFATVQGDFVVKFTQIPPAPVATEEAVDVIKA